MDLPSTLDRCLFLFAGGRGMMSHYQPVSVDGRTAAAALVREPLPLMMHGSHGSNLQP